MASKFVKMTPKYNRTTPMDVDLPVHKKALTTCKQVVESYGPQYSENADAGKFFFSFFLLLLISL